MNSSRSLDAGDDRVLKKLKTTVVHLSRRGIEGIASFEEGSLREALTAATTTTTSSSSQTLFVNSPTEKTKETLANCELCGLVHDMDSEECSLRKSFTTRGFASSAKHSEGTKLSEISPVKRNVFSDDPLPSWTKEVKISLNSKYRSQKGNVTVGYYPPEDILNLLSRESEIKAKLYSLNYIDDIDVISKKFTTRKPYCVCHTDKHKSSEMVECKYGRAGCNCRFHPSCMGRLVGDFGPDGIEAARAKINTGEMGFICPLCSEYIEEMQLSHTYCQYTFLRKKDIVTKPDESVVVDDHIEFREYKNAFNCWGVLGIDRDLKLQNEKHQSVKTTSDIKASVNDEIVVEYQAPYVPSTLANTKCGDRDGDIINIQRTFVNLLDRVSGMAGNVAGSASTVESKSTSHQIPRISASLDKSEGSSTGNDYKDSEFKQIIDPLIHARFSGIPSSLDLPLLKRNEKGLIKVRLSGAFMTKIPYFQDILTARSEGKILDRRIYSGVIEKMDLFDHSYEDESKIVSLPLIDGGVHVDYMSQSNSASSSRKWREFCGYCLGKKQSDSNVANIQLGNLSFCIHAACNDAIEYSALFYPKSGWNQQILPGALYEYKGNKDSASCYLCGLKGGILQFFQFKDYHYFPNFPRYGVLCHIPCICWLNKNHLMQSWVTILDRKILDYTDKCGLNVDNRKKKCVLSNFIVHGNEDESSGFILNSNRKVDVFELRSMERTNNETSALKIPPSEMEHLNNTSAYSFYDGDHIDKLQKEQQWSQFFGNVVWYRCTYCNNLNQSDEVTYMPAYVYDPPRIESCAFEIEEMRVESNFFLSETDKLRSQQKEPVHYIYLYQLEVDGRKGIVTLSIFENILPFVGVYNQIVNDVFNDRNINNVWKKKFSETLRMAQADAFANYDDRTLGKLPNPSSISIITRTPLDVLLSNMWRCSLCSNVSGLIVRCPVVSCSVRAHPICAQLKGWEFFCVAGNPDRIETSARINEGDNLLGGVNFSFMCNFHAARSKYKLKRKKKNEHRK